jgi:type II secretory pathway predicted ATPase ExeA
MILDYYKLSEDPFGVTPDPRYLYFGAGHREAFASLVYGTETNRGFMALIAKPGMGKTSLLYRYLEGLRGKARTAFVFRSDCDSREFIRHVLLDLGVDASGKDLPSMHDTLNRILAEQMIAGRRFVLVIDEAQNLEEKVLESVRLLSNFETPWAKLMQIVIAGQPGLAEKLAKPSMAQLRQRISMVIRLAPLTPEETNAYIDHRLQVSGCEDTQLFTSGARKVIAEQSEGIPRNINNLCFNAMSLACATKRKSIDRDAILEVLADLELDSICEKRSETPHSFTPVRAPSPSGPVLSLKKTSNFRKWLTRAALAFVLVPVLSWSISAAYGRMSSEANPGSRSMSTISIHLPIDATMSRAGSVWNASGRELMSKLQALKTGVGDIFGQSPNASSAPNATKTAEDGGEIRKSEDFDRHMAEQNPTSIPPGTGQQ